MDSIIMKDKALNICLLCNVQCNEMCINSNVIKYLADITNKV